MLCSSLSEPEDIEDLVEEHVETGRVGATVLQGENTQLNTTCLSPLQESEPTTRPARTQNTRRETRD